jgi:hypothetical protein
MKHYNNSIGYSSYLTHSRGNLRTLGGYSLIFRGFIAKLTVPDENNEEMIFAFRYVEVLKKEQREGIKVITFYPIDYLL